MASEEVDSASRPGPDLGRGADVVADAVPTSLGLSGSWAVKPDGKHDGKADGKPDREHDGPCRLVFAVVGERWCVRVVSNCSMGERFELAQAPGVSPAGRSSQVSEISWRFGGAGCA